MTKIIMENPHTGIMKTAPIGFSWTTLFFGGFPALFRGDIKWFLIQLVVAVCTSGISNLVFAFLYNKISIKELLEKGYKVKSTEGDTFENIKAKLGINLPVLKNGGEP